VTERRPEADAIGLPARVVFFGSGAFAVAILESLASDPGVNIVGVVATPDRPAGRGGRPRPTPVAARARALGLTLLQPLGLSRPETVAEVGALRPDVGVLADYGRLVPPGILGVPPHGILNVHPSLLPRHRGATPIRATIAAGDREAGVTIICLDAGIDSGPIVAAEAWPLSGQERAGELEAEAARRAAALLARTLRPWLAGTLQARPQDDAMATLTRTVRREDGRLDPTRGAAQLEREVRANDPWPGSFLETPLGRVIVRRASVAPAVAGDEPGTIVAEGGRPALATADGRLVLDDLQLEGRRALAGPEFLRGRPQFLGMRAIGASRAGTP
jgi:methionyl-tRNA formyltransferase